MATVTSSKRQLTHTSNTYESNGDVTIGGNLNINGTTTTIDTANLLVEDKNIIIGDVSSPTDSTADGGGITLKGTTDKTLIWVDSTDAWTFNQNVNASGYIHTDSNLSATGNLETNGTFTLHTISAQNSENTALVINGSGVVGTRELGSNAFNSTSFLTSYTETDTLATVTGRGATTSQAITISNQLSLNNGVGNGSGPCLTVGGSGDIQATTGGSLFFGAYNYGASTYIRGHDSSTGLQFFSNGSNVMNITSSTVNATSLNMSGNIAMGDNDVTGINKLTFTSGTFLTDVGSNYVKLNYASTGAGGIIVYDGDSALQGYLYADGASTPNFGLLDGTGSWAVKCRSNEYVQLLYDNAAKLQTTSTGVTVTGVISATGGNSTNWNTAYTDRNKWDGGSTGLTASTGRTSLGLGSAATQNTSAFATAAQGTKADNAMPDDFLNTAKITFTVGGDADTYYPVSIQGAGQYAFQMYSISRLYNATAPNTWNNSTHKGGLTLTWQYSGDGFWGGNDHDIRIIKFDETYSQMVMGIAGSVGGGGTNAGVVVWLRGGTASYTFHGPRGSDGSVNVHLTSVTASNGTVFSSRSYNASTRDGEILPKYPIRDSSLLYDNNNRVARLESPAFTGTPTAPTTSSAENSTKIATTAYVKSQGYVTSSGNTIIGTDSDINTSGAAVLDQLVMTDGVITSHSTRNLTLADLGYTGATNANNYSLPAGSGSTRGGFKIGYTESGKYYPVEVDSSEKMFVNVPWVDTNTDTNTTYSAGTHLALSGTTFNLNLGVADKVVNIGHNSTANEGEIILDTSNSGSPQISFTEHGDASWAIGVDDSDNSFKIHGSATSTIPTLANLATPLFEIATNGFGYFNGSRAFADNYHPNADTLTTARTITLAGDVTGNVSFNGSSDVSITTVVGNDSHTHDGRYYTEGEIDTIESDLYTAIGLKANLASPSFTGTPTAPTTSSAENSTKIATTAYVKSQGYLTSFTETNTFLGDGGSLTTHPGTNRLIYTGQINGGTSGLFSTSDNSNSVLTLNRHSGNYNSQLGFSSNGQIYYRKFSNSTNNNQAWVTVWHSGSDGSGSGLDADKLDAQEGSYYLNYNNFTNTPTIPSLSGYATQSYVGTQISNLVNGAPAALDTLNELAAAIDDNASYASSITTALSGKLSTTGKAADADKLDGYNAEEGAVDNSIVKRDGTASIKAFGLSLLRASTARTGITWYNESYYNWQDYMAAAGVTGCGPNGNLTAPTGLAGVTSWALRSRMEGASTYGWNWETGGSGGGGATATSKMSLNATTGNLETAGTITASGGNSTNWNTAYGWGNHASAGYVTSSGNTVIGTDSDINTSGATVVDQLNMTDGVITSHSTRTITLANLGYTGATNANNYSLPLSSSSTRGGVKIGFAESGKNYPVELDSSEKMYVNVPWVDTNTDTNTTYSAGTGLTLSGTTFSITDTISSSASNNTIVKRHSSGYIFANYFNTTPNTVSSGVTQICVETGNDGYIRHGDAAAVRSFINVASGANNYSLPAGSSSTRGGFKIGFSESGKNYPVETSSEKMYVNVPWTDTNTNTTYSAGTGITLSGTTFSLTDTASKLSLSGGTLTGDLVVEDSEIHVGDKSNDEWTRFLHTSENGYGFNWQHTNASVFVNEQGSTNQVMVLGDVDAGNSNSGLFGIAHSGNGGSSWTKKLDLRGDGDLYIGSSGTSKVFHDGYHPNADTLTTARTIAGTSFNGSSNIDISYNNLTNKPTIPTNNNQLSNGAGYVTSSGNTIIGTDSDIDTSGATVIDQLNMTDGVITSHSTRTLTLANLGYTGATNANNYSLPEATATERGGIELFSNTDQSVAANSVSATSGRTYGIQLNSAGQAVVNVPWSDTNTDTNTTYSAGRGLDLSGTEFQLETDLRDSINLIGLDSNDYLQWSNNSYLRSVVNGSERFRVNTSGIDVTGTATANAFRTDTGNTDYNVISRNGTSTTLWVQAAQSGSLQGIASFRYGSATVNQGTEVCAIRRNSSYFINTKLGVGTSSPSTALHVSGTITQTIYNPSSFPSASPAGQRAFAYSYYPLATSHGSVVSTYGSYIIPVYSDGSSWRAG